MSNRGFMGLPPYEAGPTAGAGANEGGESIDLLRIAVLVTAEWRLGLITALIVAAVGLGIIARLPEQFEAYTVMLPKDAPGGGSAISAFFGGARPSSTSVSLLASRTLKDDVIRRVDLRTYFRSRSQEAARLELASRTNFYPGTDTITVQVRDRSAEMAARIANAYIDALRAMQEKMATTQNDLQRRFFEEQVQREKDALVRSETELERLQEGLGVVQVDTQTQIGLSAIADVRAQITVLQVRLAVLLRSETEENPEVETVRSQIAQLQIQEHQLEAGSGLSTGPGVAAPAGRMPAVNLEYQRKLREVRFHEALVSSLSNHFEDIRLGASTPGQSFEVIDPAVIPEFPTWPPRQPYRFLALGTGVLAGFVAIAAKLGARRLLRNPVRKARLGEIRGHFVRGR